MNLKEVLLAVATTPEDVEEWGSNRGVRRPDWPTELYVVLSTPGSMAPDAMCHGKFFRSWHPTLNDIVADDWEVMR